MYKDTEWAHFRHCETFDKVGFWRFFPLPRTDKYFSAYWFWHLRVFIMPAATVATQFYVKNYFGNFLR